MKSKLEIRSAWLTELQSTSAADRARAEAAIARLYAAAKFPAPRHVVWFDSPFEASWAVAVLVAPYHQIWRDKLSSSSLSTADRGKIDGAKATLSRHLGASDWNETLRRAGAPRGAHLAWPPNPSRMFHSAFLEARFGLVSDVSELFVVYGEDDDLTRAEAHYAGPHRGVLRSALCCPTTDLLIGESFFEEYSFSKMADDELRTIGRDPPALLSAAWDVARSSGLWWPFENLAIASDRPSEVHLNEKFVPHREDGPAIVFRNADRAFAWNGKAVPERWILDPTSVPTRDYKGFDPTFAKFVQAKTGGTKKAPRKTKPGAILQSVLPSDPAVRLEQLRAAAGGPLPFFERYRAGEHVAVWKELVALGPGVRGDAHAADALAVAYATMERVAANVDTLIDRLTKLGYQFKHASRPSAGGLLQMGGMAFDISQLLARAAGGAKRQAATPSPHQRPADGLQKTLIDFERQTAVMPLSIRAFFEVVGEVNLVGTHPSIAPRNGETAPDPLVVDAFDEGMVEYDEEEETPLSLMIAPDDLHKADTSGGDPYEIAIPDPRADGIVLNERHELLFVDYLRLCFRFGGFPGYEGRVVVPPEIETLSRGLREF